MNWRNRRPQAARELQRERCLGCALVGPSTEAKRRPTLGGELTLERGELDRLPFGDGARAQVAGARLQDRRRRADTQRDRECGAMKRVVAIPEEDAGMDASDDKS